MKKHLVGIVGLALAALGYSSTAEAAPTFTWTVTRFASPPLPAVVLVNPSSTATVWLGGEFGFHVNILVDDPAGVAKIDLYQQSSAGSCSEYKASTGEYLTHGGRDPLWDKDWLWDPSWGTGAPASRSRSLMLGFAGFEDRCPRSLPGSELWMSYLYVTYTAVATNGSGGAVASTINLKSF